MKALKYILKLILKVILFLVALLIVLLFIFYLYIFINETRAQNAFKDRYIKSEIGAIIASDKIHRREYLEKEGFSKDEIEKNLLSVADIYQRERDKYYTYCNNNSKHCTLNENTFFDGSVGVSIHITYRFDKESVDFFNKYREDRLVELWIGKKSPLCSNIHYPYESYKKDICREPFGDYLYRKIK